MHDLNFFEDYVEQREFKLNNKLIYFSIFGVLILLLTGYITYNMFVIKNQQEIISALKQEAESPSTLSRVEAIKEKEEQLNHLKETMATIKILDIAVEEAKKIDDIFLEEINDNIPNNIFLTSIRITEEGISMIGISKDRWAIPEFQKNLQYIGGYDEVFVPYITLEDERYNFALDMTKRGVIEDEGTD